jgi:AbrB family looped-hinge helix DNA binding protein
MEKLGRESFYGAATVGEKGQVVIPAEARKAIGAKKGEKLLVFGMGGDIVVMLKLSNLKKFAAHLSGRLNAIHSVIKKTKIK